MSSSQGCQCKFSRVIISPPICTLYRITHANCVPNGFKILKVPFYNFFCSVISVVNPLHLDQGHKVFYSSKCLILWVVAGGKNEGERAGHEKETVQSASGKRWYLRIIKQSSSHSGCFFLPFVTYSARWPLFMTQKKWKKGT